MGQRESQRLLLSWVLGVAALPGLLLAGPPAGGVEGVHGALPGFPVNSCFVCHDIVPGATGRDAVQRPNETCFGCHTDGPTYGEGDPFIQDRPHATPVGNHADLITGSGRFTYGDFGLSWPYPGYEQQIDCTTCHDPHRTFDPSDPSPSTNNTKYVRDHTDDFRVVSGSVVYFPSKTIKVIDNTGATPATVTKVVDQDIVYTGPADFADGIGLSVAEADVCEVCHTLTNHHQVDGTAPGGQSHFDGQDCTSCHSHPTGFAPSGGGQPLTGPHAAFGDPDCGTCHDSTFFPGAADNPAGLASVFCQTCHGPADTNYSEIHSHLVTGSGKFDYTIECTSCHDQHGWDITNVDGNPNLDYVKATINETITVIDNTAGGVPVTKTINSAIVFDSLDDFANGDSFYGRDVCVTCHTLTSHHQNDGTAPLGQSHRDGEDCTACHTHPTGFAPSGGDPLTGPHASFGDPDCGACHDSSFFPGAADNPDGLSSVFCQTCHGPGSANFSEIHSHLVTGSGRFEYTIECSSCHDQHGWDITNVDGDDNIQYVKARVADQITVIDNTAGGVPVTKTIDSDIVFTAATGAGSFADGDALYDRDLCVTCHTLTNHHQNDGSAPGGQSHFDGQDCTTCHQHFEGFATPGGLSGPPLQGPHAMLPGQEPQDCLACHDSSFFPGAADNPGGAPSVFCATCHDPDSVARIHSHTVTGSSRFDYTVECTSCHDQHGWDITNIVGNLNLDYIKANLVELITVIDNTQVPPVQVDKLISSNIVFDSLDDFADGDALYDRDLCVTCHTLTNHHQNDGTAPSGQSHFDGEDCTTCHRHPEGFRPPGGLAGPPVEGPHAAIPGFANGDCLVCHSLYPTVDEMQANSTTVCLSCHSESWTIVSATPEHVHSSVVTGSTRFDYSVECAACHAPHGWQAEIDNVEGSQNIKYVRGNVDEMITVVDNTVTPPAVVTKTVDHDVVFTATTGPGSFADGDGTYTEDVCNTCHTLTNHHQNDGSAPGGQSHFDGQACTSCHLHPEGFGGFGGPHPQAETDCGNCHLGQDGEADLPGIHGNACETCHTVAVPDTFLGPVGTWNQECSDCHNPFTAETGYMDVPAKGHRCVVCHGQQLGTSDLEEIHKEHVEKANCVVCHGSIPDTGVEIGSGNRDVCHLCHVGGKNGDVKTIHRKHTKEGLSCLECHGGVRPPVDVVDGPPVGGASNVCDLCHNSRDPSDFDDGDHKKHSDNRLDCGSCHKGANLQDDRFPMPPIDDSVRSMLHRAGFNECSHCHGGGESGSSEEVHEEHVANQWQWCYNCHQPEDLRPTGGEPPVTRPDQACRLCHGGESYNDSFPFDIHDEHAGKNKCYTCHQAKPPLFDWPKAWLGGVDPGPGPGDGVSVADLFSTVSFSNNDGPDDWAGPWLENDPLNGGGGPNAGQVRVLDGALRLDDRPDTGGQPSAARSVDLSGLTSATLSFDWSTSNRIDWTDEITVEVSANGGASYTTLQKVTAFFGARSRSESFDISGFISADTTIRFRVSRGYGGYNEYFYADNVQIEAE